MSLAQLETIIVLLVAVLGITAVSRRLLLPYPILLVVGGVALAAIPGIPPLTLDPELVFLVFLPPILWAAAYFTSLNEFTANRRPIFLLAFGLVLVTTAVVAALARAIFPDMSWAAAVALGAIVSPPDAVAATSILRPLRIPGRIVTVLEGESLVNDATALVLYRVAVGAVVTGTFSWGDAAGQFFAGAIVGVAIGMVVGLVASYALRLNDGALSDALLTLLAPYTAWIIAELFHVSGVLACVAGGLMMRRHFSVRVSPETRLQARIVWDFVVFLLTGLVFILIGLQIEPLRAALPGQRLMMPVLAGLAVAGITIVTRLVWVPVIVWLPRALSARVRARDPLPPRSWTFMVAWTGMRGVVSLAAALALPLATSAGAPFPHRAEIVAITFVTILVTLVVQGLTLAPVVRLLGLHEERDRAEQARRHARAEALNEALRRLDDPDALRPEWRPHLDSVKQLYAGKLRALRPTEANERFERRALRLHLLDVERGVLIGMRNRGDISDEVLVDLERDLDVESSQLHRSQAREESGRAAALSE